MQMIKKVAAVVITLIATVGFGHSVSAQMADTPRPERQAERITRVMAERLELTDRQKKKVSDLNMELADKKRSLMENKEIDFWDRLEELKKIPEIRAEKLQSILNGQQYRKYQALNNRKRQGTQ